VGPGADGAALLRHVAQRYLSPEARLALQALYQSDRLAPRPPVETAAAEPRSSGRLPAAAGAPQRVGPYRLERELARGGMGSVHRAVHPGLQQAVAVKLLLAGAQATERQRERFLLEARAAARLRHPGIVSVHDVGAEGEALYLVMDLVEGESLADRIEREPNEPTLWNTLGVIHRRRGDLPGAIEAYGRAIDLGDASALANRGVARGLSGDLAGALRDLDAAIEATPDAVAAWYHRGGTRLRLGRLREARGDFDRAIALDPKHAAALSDRGYVRSGLGDAEGAEQDFARALALDPTLGAALLNRGALRQRRGHLDGALADFDRALALTPPMIQAYALRGVLLLKRGDHAGAVRDLRRYLQAAPDASDAPAMRRALADAQAALARSGR